MIYFYKAGIKMTTGDHLKPVAVDKKPSREVFIIAQKPGWK